MSDAQLQTSYALSKQVPDMGRGFTIATNYGDIPITTEESAPFVALAQAVLTARATEQAPASTLAAARADLMRAADAGSLPADKVQAITALARRGEISRMDACKVLDAAVLKFVQATHITLKAATSAPQAHKEPA